MKRKTNYLINWFIANEHKCVTIIIVRLSFSVKAKGIRFFFFSFEDVSSIESDTLAEDHCFKKMYYFPYPYH